jgi:hypothetical protein
MIKWVFKTIGLLLLAVIIFLALALWKGGEPFRWLGRQSEQAGEMVKEKSEELSKEADKIKQKTDAVRETTKKVTKGIRRTGEKIKEFSGSGTEE